MSVRTWLKEEEIFDPELEELLEERGIQNIEDMQYLSQMEWDDLWSKAYVQRFKLLNDQKARLRLQKKMKKLEKIWRKHSGIANTSIKSEFNFERDKNTKTTKHTVGLAGSVAEDAMSKAPELRIFLRDNGVWEKDLFLVLVNSGINTTDDLQTIKNEHEFDKIVRQVRVQRTAELKSPRSRVRLDKLLAKFEKLWRKQTGIKKTSMNKRQRRQRARTQGTLRPSKTDKDLLIDSMSEGDGHDLKEFLRREQIWEKQLYDELIYNGINNQEILAALSVKEFDDIVRKVRVDRFLQLKDQKARQRVDKLLVKFEKIWRKVSGHRKTSLLPIHMNSNSGSGSSDVSGGDDDGKKKKRKKSGGNKNNMNINTSNDFFMVSLNGTPLTPKTPSQDYGFLEILENAMADLDLDADEEDEDDSKHDDGDEK